MGTKAPVGSLEAMKKKVHEAKLAAAKKPAARTSASATSNKAKEFANDSDTSSDDSSSSSSDSDSDSDVGEERLRALRKKMQDETTAKKTAASKVNGAKPTTPSPGSAKATKPSPSPKKQKADTSSESDSDSGSDSSSESESENEEDKTKSNPDTKMAGADTDSDSSDEFASADEEPSGSRLDGATSADSRVADHVQTSKKAESTSSDESDSDESDDDNEVDPLAVAKKNGAANDKSAAATVVENGHSAEVIAPPAWLNGSDFTLRKASSENPGKEVSDFFSKTNLEGKQVWYFTAPSSLPITVLKDVEIDLAKAMSGGAMLHHDSDAYGLDLEPYTTNAQIQLLIPSKGGEKYSTLNRKIDSAVHVRRIAEFGGDSKISSTATDEYIPKIRPAKEQPKGLRARYTPIGVPTQKPAPLPLKAGATAESDSSESDSDEEMADALPTPKPQAKSRSAAATDGGVKRKQPADEDSSDESSDSSDSEEEEAVPLAQAKATKRAKTSASPADLTATKSTPVVPKASMATKLSKASDSRKETPVPLPSLGGSFSSSLPVPEATPSKAPSSKHDGKKAKSTDKPKRISTSAIPPPTVGVSK